MRKVSKRELPLHLEVRLTEPIMRAAPTGRPALMDRVRVSSIEHREETETLVVWFGFWRRDPSGDVKSIRDLQAVWGHETYRRVGFATSGIELERLILERLKEMYKWRGELMERS